MNESTVAAIMGMNACWPFVWEEELEMALDIDVPCSWLVLILSQNRRWRKL